MPVAGASPHPLIAEYDRMSLEERRAFWQQQFLKCIKCYGCRNICPECFCENCALEDPLWVEPGILAPPFPSFHLDPGNAYGDSLRPLPPVRTGLPGPHPVDRLYELVRRDVAEMLGYEPGADFFVAPPLPLTPEEAPIKGGRL